MVNAEYAEAFSQVINILEHLEPNLAEKIPENVKNVLNENSLEKIDKKNQYTGNIGNMNISPKACSILAIIYLNCLCSPEEKEEYIKLLQKNDKIYHDMENDKVAFDDLFNKKVDEIESNKKESKEIILYKKENLFMKLLNKMKSIFK